ncbi:PQQ-binding-like beta-propeller repeat protein [Planctomycetota bacterium]
MGRADSDIGGRRRPIRRASAIGLAALLAASAGAGEGRLIASPEAGWPQWRGPRRDGISDETGLLQSWPEGGPRLLWKASGLGRGYSSPIIVGGRIYITGDVGQELLVYAFDLDGKRLWRTANGKAWRKSHPGARACCAYSDGRLYHMNAHGRVACLDPASGKEVWAADVLGRFGGKVINWGLSECLLVDGPRVVVTPGGTKALMAALDKKTGATVWASEPLTFERTVKFGGKPLPEPVTEADKAGYAPPILFELGGRRHIVSCSARHAFGVDADTGKLLWTLPLPTRHEVLSTTPLLCRDSVLVRGSNGKGSKLLRIRADGGQMAPEEAWTTPLDTTHYAAVLVDGRIYGGWYRGPAHWACIEPETGAVLHQTRDVQPGPVLYADGCLYCLGQDGEAALLEPTPDGFEVKGRFRLIEQRKKDAWAHPVILDGHLYLRYHDALYCYDIKAK